MPVRTELMEHQYFKLRIILEQAILDVPCADGCSGYEIVPE